MPKKVNKEERKAELAHMALDVLAEKGYEKATIQDIADHAGIGKGTFYEYFKTKDEILDEITKSFKEDFVGGLGQLFEAVTDPKHQLQIMLTETMAAAEGAESLMKVYMELWIIIMRKEKLHLKSLFDDLLDDWRKIIVQVLEAGKEKGQFREDVDSHDLACFLTGAMDGIGMHYMNQQEIYNIHKVTQMLSAMTAAFLDPNTKHTPQEENDEF